MKEVKTVGELRELLKWSEDDEPLYFDLQDPETKEKELVKCVGAGCSGGGRITVLWLDKIPKPGAAPMYVI